MSADNLADLVRKASTAPRPPDHDPGKGDAPAATPTPGYLDLERVQTRINPDVMTALRLAAVRLRSRRGAAPGERMNSNTVLRSALAAVVASGALDECEGKTEAEITADITAILTRAK